MLGLYTNMDEAVTCVFCFPGKTETPVRSHDSSRFVMSLMDDIRKSLGLVYDVDWRVSDTVGDTHSNSISVELPTLHPAKSVSYCIVSEEMLCADVLLEKLQQLQIQSGINYCKTEFNVFALLFVPKSLKAAIVCKPEQEYTQGNKILYCI